MLLLFDELENDDDDDEELGWRRINVGEALVPLLPTVREPKVLEFCCPELLPNDFGCAGLVVVVERPNPDPLIADLLADRFANPPAGALVGAAN